MSTSNYLILVGPPNSGKTTLFNWITGYKRQVVNYPGSTIDLFFGSIRNQTNAPAWNIVDTPGIYHLFSKNNDTKYGGAEEQIVQKILEDSIQKEELRGVILVLDSTRLARQLPLAFYLQSMGIPFVIALTMYDLQKKQKELDLALLSKKLKTPVYPIEGLLGGGIRKLLLGVYDYFKQKIKPANVSETNVSQLGMSQANVSQASMFQAIAWSEKQQAQYLKKAHNIVQSVYFSKKESLTKNINQLTQRLDSWLLHPVFGFGFLSLILFIFFSGIFWVSQPLMDGIDSSFNWLAEQISAWGSGEGGRKNQIIDFLANGVIVSFGAFFVFVPQVFILFFGIHFLEASGYLARAVSLVDGPFARIGLSGKSLIPFLSGFACAIPAVLSTRTITSKREKWITIFVIPLMTCSARLPVYALLLSFLFFNEPAWKPGIMMALLYFFSLFLGVFGAGILNFFLKKETKSDFMIELPLYRRPLLSHLISNSWSRTKHFIWKAGPVICLLALLMWGALHFPQHPELNSKKQIQNSYAGQFGQLIEPVFHPMGVDWRVGVSLLSAFVAREVFVSVLAVTLQNTSSQKHSSSLLQNAKLARKPNGQFLFSIKSVMSLLVFFIFSLQCLSTTGIVYKETGSWKFASLQLVIFNILGYFGAVLTYHLF